MSTIAEFEEKLSALGAFWERIEFPNGFVVGPGRNKGLLWQDYLSKYIDKSKIKDKSVLDIGCNAGGNIIELANFEPSRLVGIEANETFYNQALFVIDQFRIDAEIKKYKISPEKNAIEYELNLGQFDVIFCLGVVYHLNKRTNIEMLKYIRNNSKICYFSSQLFQSDKRAGVDWNLTKEGHEELFVEAGFRRLETIYEKKESDNWAGLTNQWYFEAI